MSLYGPDITFTSIQQIRDHQFVGNAASDMKAFDAIHNFVVDPTTSVDDKYEALDLMGINGMGLDPMIEEYPDVSKQEMIATYLDNI